MSTYDRPSSFGASGGRRLVLALLTGALSGCSWLFQFDAAGDGGGDGDDAGRDAGRDGSVDAATDAACGRSTLPAPIVADTQISAAEPIKNWGSSPTLAIAVAAAILRFDVSQVPAEARVCALRLVLTPAVLSDDCGPPECQPCAGHERDGPLDLYFLRSDWEEHGASWTQRTAMDEWDTAGALTGDLDRSADPVASVTRAAGEPAIFEVVAHAAADGWLLWRSPDGALSFQVVPRPEAAMTAATRESVEDGCGSYDAPHLEVDYEP